LPRLKYDPFEKKPEIAYKKEMHDWYPDKVYIIEPMICKTNSEHANESNGNNNENDENRIKKKVHHKKLDVSLPSIPPDDIKA
jgi:hypothetical protein